MNIIIITAGHSLYPSLPTFQQLRLQTDSLEKPLHAHAVNLLVVDSRRMNPACLEAALQETTAINHKIGFNFGLLLCRTATLKLTLDAMRTGLRDIVEGSLSAHQLRAVLRACMPNTKIRASHFSAFAALVRTLSGGNAARQLPSKMLAHRENELTRRAEQLANIEKRLTFDREALAARDQALSENTRRFNDQFSRFQMDAEVLAPPPPVAHPAVSLEQLQTLSAHLEQRARDLDFRQKLLSEMESLLSTQPLASHTATP